jgi:hypothetical protein
MSDTNEPEQSPPLQTPFMESLNNFQPAPTGLQQSFDPELGKWHAAFQDPANNGGVTPEAIDASKVDDNPQDFRDLSININGLAYLTGKNPAEVGMNYEQAKQEYVKFQNWDMPKTEAQFRNQLGGHVENQFKRHEAVTELYSDTVLKALEDTDYGNHRGIADFPTDITSVWTQKNAPLIADQKERETYDKNARAIYLKTLKDVAPIRKEIATSLKVLNDFTTGKVGDEDIQKLGAMFKDMPADKMDKILSYVQVASSREKLDKKTAKGFFQNLGESISRGGDFAGDMRSQDDLLTLDKMQKEILNGKDIYLRNDNYLEGREDNDFNRALLAYKYNNSERGQHSDSSSFRKATAEQIAVFKTQIDDRIKSVKLGLKLRSFAQNSIDPITPLSQEGTWARTGEQMLYDVGSSIAPMVATALNPVLGYKAYQTMHFDSLVQKNPDGDLQHLNLLSEIEGAFEAVGDLIQIRLIKGIMPKLVDNYVKKLGNKAVRAGLRVMEAVGFEYMVETAQDALPAAVEGAATAMGDDIQQTATWDDFKVFDARRFWAVAFMGGVGAGVATFRDLKDPARQLNRTIMGYNGVFGANAEHVLAAESPEEATARWQEVYSARTPEDIAKGDQMRIDDFSKPQAKEQGVDVVAPEKNAAGETEWVVSDPAGKEVGRFSNEEAARGLASDRVKAQIVSEQNAVLDLVDWWLKRDSNNTVETLAPKSVQQELDRMNGIGDAAGLANLHQRITFGVEAGDIKPDADLNKVFIMGGARLETISEGVFRGVISLAENAKLEDAAEEINHVFIKRAIAEGRTTIPQLQSWIDQTNKATGTTYAYSTETDVMENTAKIALDYAAGRLDESVMPQSFVDYMKQLLLALKEVMLRVIKLKEAFADGKIDRRFEELLAESLGLDPQIMFDRESDRVAGEIAGDSGNTAYSISRREAKKSTDEILSPTGHRDWGIFTNTDEKRSKGEIQAGPIRLLKGSHWGPNKGFGIDHIEAEHLGDFDAFSQPMESMIHGVLLNFNEVYRQSEGRLILLQRRPSMMAAVELRPENKDGESIYSVVTSFPKNNPLWKPEGVRILDGRRATLTPSERVPTPTAQETTSPNLPLEPLVGKYSEEYLQQLRQPVNQSNVSFSIRARDEAYDAAVKAGDEETQQKLVDEAAREAGYTVGPVYHGTPTGGFDVFHEQPTYFAHDKDHADIYQSSTASSIRVTGTPDGTPETKKVFLKADNVFDTRKPKDRERFEQGFLGKGGEEWGSNGTPIGDRGLPDWTDGRDLVDWIKEEGLSYDALALDEGGFPQADGTVKVKGASVVVWKPHQIKSADPVTRDDAGNVIPLSQRFNAESNDIRYSIRSQENIDSVTAAMQGSQSFSEPKLSVYEKAKQRFTSVLEKNRDTLQGMQDAGASSLKIRNEKLKQALIELDGILKTLPYEVRGRVGGMSVLANIGTGDKALADFFIKRVGMLDKELERYLSKEYDESIYKFLQATLPKKAKAGEKPKGIGADIQKMFAIVREARDWSSDEVNAHIAGLEYRIDNENLSPEMEARLTREADLVAAIGDWKNKTSDAKRQSLEMLKATWSQGYVKYLEKLVQQKADRDAGRAGAITNTGKDGLLRERQEENKKQNGLGGKFKKGYFNLLSWDHFVSVLFGENSETTNLLANGERAASNRKVDRTNAKMDEIADLFTKLAGGKLAGETLRYNMAQKSIKPFTGTPWTGLEFSQLEALSATMLWMQEDGKRHMEGKLDDAGNPLSSWHYNDEFVKTLEDSLSPEAKAVRSFLLTKYATGYHAINKVYTELNGVSLPQIANYSPVTVAPVTAPKGMTNDPVTGAVTSGRGSSPSALRTRGVQIAEPKFADVLQTYQAHTMQMEHWMAYAPFMKEVNGILRNRDVQNAIEAKGGEEAKRVLNLHLDIMDQGGVRDAANQLGLNQTLSKLGGRAAQVALVGRLSTILLQSTQLGASLAEMPTGAYILRMSKLLSGNLGWGDALKSSYIQRRLKEMPPIVRQAMEGLNSDKPNVLKHKVAQLGRLISGADALFTAGTYAMVYDYHLKQAKQMGIPSPEEYARSVAERATDKLAQPTRTGARSLYENTITHPLARAGWNFASESRKNAALAAYALAERPAAVKSRTLFMLLILNSLASTVIRNAWKDATDDDDDEVFDEKHWGLKRMALTSITDPLQGIPLLGDAVKMAAFKTFGEYAPSGNLYSMDGAVSPFAHIDKYTAGDWDWEMAIKDLDHLFSGAGLLNANIAAAASITHLAKDLFGAGKNAVKTASE